jgi:hypothetical protein
MIRPPQILVHCAAAAAVLLMTGCFPALENRRSVESAFTPIEMRINSDGTRVASVGEYIALGNMEVMDGPAWRLKQPLKTTLPGTLGIGFDVSIQPCVLEAWYQCDDGLAFVAPSRFATATYDGKSVFADQDELGIRVSPDGKQVKLYCDNGVFNGFGPGATYCIWSRPIKPDELAKFEKVSRRRIFPQTDARGLLFSGVSGGKLILTLENWEMKRAIASKGEVKDYTFDLSRTGPTKISVQGCVIEVLSATPEGLTYRVLKPFEE